MLFYTCHDVCFSAAPLKIAHGFWKQQRKIDYTFEQIQLFLGGGLNGCVYLYIVYAYVVVVIRRFLSTHGSLLKA